jgi:hypothetical protein
MPHQSYLSFLGGELSPYLRHRIDFEKHASGSERMENFLPLPFGGFRKRPGTLYQATLSAATRLQAFRYNVSTGYILAFTTTNLKVFRSDGTLAATVTANFSDPFALQFAQVNDVLFIADPGNYPRRLSRVSDTSWTLEDIPFLWTPVLDENDDDAWTLSISVAAGFTSTAAWATSTAYVVGDQRVVSSVKYRCVVAHTSSAATQPGVGASWTSVWRRTSDLTSSWVPTGTIFTLTSSKPLFSASHVGAVFQQNAERKAANFESILVTDAGNNGRTSTPLVIQGKWIFQTFGNQGATWTIQRSKDQGNTWEDIRSYTLNGERNISAEGEEKEKALIRTKLTWFWDQANSNPRGILSSSEGFIPGLMQVTGYTSSTSVTAVAVTPLELDTTEFWSEGAFSAEQGYPATVTVHDRRLIFAGTSKRPLSLWLSAADDLLNFQQGTDADSSIYVTLAAVNQDPIRWIASQRRLIVGTAGGEWVFGSDTSDEAITPTNVIAREYSRVGSAASAALVMGESLFFLERQRRRLREYSYLLEREAYASADLSRLAEHITESGIAQFDWQQNREPCLWAVRADGVLLSFFYNRDEKIAAWSRHTTVGGSFKSIAVLRNESDDDDVWFVVLRDGVYYLEKLAASMQSAQEAGTIATCHHVDCGVVGSSSFVSGQHRLNVAGTFLNGQTVAANANGTVYTGPVTSGYVVLAGAVTNAIVGLPVTSTLTTLPLDVQTEEGPTLSRKKRACSLAFNLFASAGGSITANGVTRPIEHPAAGLNTGWYRSTLDAGHFQDLQISFTHSDPLPFTVRAAVVDWQLHEK